MTVKKYLAITIGPILETINVAQSTKELAAASGFFSDWSRTIVNKLKNDDLSKVIEKQISPYESSDLDMNNEVEGNSPDILFYELKNEYSEFDSLLKAIEETKKEMVKGIEYSEKIVNYLQCHSVIYELDDKDNAIENGSEILSLMEQLQFKKPTENFRKENSKKEKEVSRYLIECSIDKIANKKLVPSTTDIALYSLNRNLEPKEYYEEVVKIRNLNKDMKEIDEEKIAEKVIKNVLKYEDKLPKYSKYAVVLQGDGDGMGKLLKTKYENEDKSEYDDLQKVLNKFSESVREKITKFGGYPVYVGGDDILCFLPIIGIIDSESKSFIDFAKALDDDFKNQMSKSDDISLSFGATIYYYKHPLNIARNIAENLLFNTAKNVVLNGKEKDTMAIKLIKHSGKKNEINIYFSDDEYFKAVNTIIDKSKEISEFKEKLLTSVIHKLVRDQALIIQLMIKNYDFENRLKNYFANNFNEDVHGKSEIKEYIEAIENLLIESKRIIDYENIEKSSEFEEFVEKMFKQVIEILELAHFFQEN